MAQSPDNKTTHASHDSAARDESERKAQTAMGQIGSAERSAAATGASAARQGSEAGQDAIRQSGETLRQSGAAVAETVRMSTTAGTEAARRSADTLAEGYRQLLTQTAEQYETIGQRMAEATQETASRLRAFVPIPGTTTEDLRDLQDSVAGLVSGIVQSNVRASQELVRLADPAAVFDIQRWFVRDWLDTLLQGTGLIIRLSQQAAEQTLRPIEGQIERRRQNQGSGSNQGSGAVADVMSQGVRLVTPEDTVQQATRLMRDEDTGVLPVGEGDRLVGMITDRDVALRLVAEGKDPTRTKVREIMTQDVKYVFEDEDIGHVADNMAEQQVHRLPVVNRAKRVVGIVSLSDLARGSRSGHLAGRAMRGIARESGRHMPGAAE